MKRKKSDEDRFNAIHYFIRHILDNMEDQYIETHVKYLLRRYKFDLNFKAFPISVGDEHEEDGRIVHEGPRLDETLTDAMLSDDYTPEEKCTLLFLYVREIYDFTQDDFATYQTTIRQLNALLKLGRGVFSAQTYTEAIEEATKIQKQLGIILTHKIQNNATTEPTEETLALINEVLGLLKAARG
jgi:hypothetical protein